ncbi:Cj0069 family protein [Candidatus Entotheonella palauensis]|uniref:Cj0069 family protein n=1 Tax=Candidatus Entotheonella palauensis TaxID=93172 RepID=UPI000B7E3573|nr:Cj0069 family protein [Candidatus Entotheonella palauensis]
MTRHRRPRIAILYPGDYETRQAARADNNRFAQVFQALSELGVDAEPAVYHPAFWQEVRDQVLQVDSVLVWVNPIQDGHDRTILDAMLGDVAATGVFVSAHPDIIQKMGTKEVLYRTRHLGWGSDTHLYQTMGKLQQALPIRLATGEARVLKQCRGHSGLGVWKVQWINPAASHGGDPGGRALPELDALVRARHAQRGSLETEMSLAAFFKQCEPYLVGSGKLIDQAYQLRLPEGMIRCYLVQDQVAGFGHQAINALYPAPPGAPSSEAPQPGPRLYYPPTVPEFRMLKRKLEREWLPAFQQELDIETTHLPILWDADFLLGPKEATGEDTYVLCEINVSSVAPFPESTVPVMAQAALAQVQSRRHRC